MCAYTGSELIVGHIRNADRDTHNRLYMLQVWDAKAAYNGKPKTIKLKSDSLERQAGGKRLTCHCRA